MQLEEPSELTLQFAPPVSLTLTLPFEFAFTLLNGPPLQLELEPLGKTRAYNHDIPIKTLYINNIFTKLIPLGTYSYEPTPSFVNPYGFVVPTFHSAQVHSLKANDASSYYACYITLFFLLYFTYLLH